MKDSLLYVRALHECGHAIVGWEVGHEVFRIVLSDDGDYCDGGYLSPSPGGSRREERKRALVALGGYFALAAYGQGLGWFVNGRRTAEQDFEEFETYRDGMTFRHARAKVQKILRAKEAELKALAARVVAERVVIFMPYPSEMNDAQSA